MSMYSALDARKHFEDLTTEEKTEFQVYLKACSSLEAELREVVSKHMKLLTSTNNIEWDGRQQIELGVIASQELLSGLLAHMIRCGCPKRELMRGMAEFIKNSVDARLEHLPSYDSFREGFGGT